MSSVEDIITREVAAAVEEQRSEVFASVMDYLYVRRNVEESALRSVSVRVLNGECALVEGEPVCAEMASHLRGAGYDVLHEGSMLTARLRKRAKRPHVTRERMLSRAKRPSSGDVMKHGLRFFNDTKSINWARKAYNDMVGAPDWRFFPRFLESLDNVIADARTLAGLSEDDDVDEGLDGNSAPVVQDDGRGVVAALEDEDGGAPDQPDPAPGDAGALVVPEPAPLE